MELYSLPPSYKSSHILAESILLGFLESLCDLSLDMTTVLRTLYISTEIYVYTCLLKLQA